ncbi:MAG: ATP-binding protein [Oscillospiraceae bacterium]
MASQTFIEAMKIINIRQQRAIEKAEKDYDEVTQKIPRIRMLTNFLSQTNIKLSKTIFSSGSNSGEIFAQIMEENLKAQREIKDLLVKNGYSKDCLDIKYTCSICQDKGFVKGKRCTCVETLMKEINIKKLNSATSLKLHTFDSFSLDYYSDKILPNKKTEKQIMGEIVQSCKDYAAKFSLKSPSILMIGDTGLGKTHLTLAIASEVIKKGKNVLYVSALDMFRELQNEHFGKNQTQTNTIQGLLDADLVIIDDLGAEFETSFNISALYNIVNTRLNLCHPTIINTNLTSKEIESRYTPRLASRIMTLYKCLKFVGKDVREIKLRNHEI